MKFNLVWDTNWLQKRLKELGEDITDDEDEGDADEDEEDDEEEGEDEDEVGEK